MIVLIHSHIMNQGTTKIRNGIINWLLFEPIKCNKSVLVISIFVEVCV